MYLGKGSQVSGPLLWKDFWWRAFECLFRITHSSSIMLRSVACEGHSIWLTSFSYRIQHSVTCIEKLLSLPTRWFCFLCFSVRSLCRGCVSYCSCFSAQCEVQTTWCEVYFTCAIDFEDLMIFKIPALRNVGLHSLQVKTRELWVIHQGWNFTRAAHSRRWCEHAGGQGSGQSLTECTRLVPEGIWEIGNHTDFGPEELAAGCNLTAVSMNSAPWNLYPKVWDSSRCPWSWFLDYCWLLCQGQGHSGLPTRTFQTIHSSIFFSLRMIDHTAE